MKVNPLKMSELLAQGKTQAEVAKYFHVSRAAISKRLTKVAKVNRRNMALKAISQIKDDRLNPQIRLKKIGDIVEKELEGIQVALKNSTGKEKQELQKLQLLHVDEIRKQISLLLDIAQTMYTMEQIDLFKQTVLEEIGRESEELRDRIVRRLRCRQAYSELS